MKKISLILLTMILILCVSSCSKAETEAKNAFENMMTAFKTCDEGQIGLYYDFDNIVAYISENNAEEFKTAVINTLSDMEYKIISTDKIDAENVKIKIELTTIDFSKIVDSYIDSVFETISSTEYTKKIQNMTDDEYKKIMTEQMITAIENSDRGKTTKNVELTMKKNEAGWVLGSDSKAFLGALFENLSNAVNSLI